MTDLTIRLGDLHQLAGLLPEATPPRMVAEVAQWAVELAEVKAGCDLIGGDCFAARVIGDFEVIEDDAPEPPEPAETEPAPALRAEAQEPAAARPWTPAEDETLLSMFASGAKLGDIAEALGRTEIGVNTRRQRLLPTDPRANIPQRARPWTEAEDETLLAMYQSGARLGEIAEAVGRTVRAVDVRRHRLARTDPRATPAVKGSAVAASTETAKRRRVKPRKAKPPQTAAAPAVPDGVAHLVDCLAELDDNFEPADDELLVRQRYLGVGFADIAAELGCDEATAKARWREILKCGVKHAGGIVTEKGWDELRAAVAQRAAEVEG
ncbi:hypothetical protein SAMN05444389_101423 [Paracoccus solventivorans]|uniref:Uncharacterized protein n=1 Tax=Paracoccus solventivorans TaxID=53463 RepID=A0A1M7DL63_9RHOB|nr:hypothetical protein [Paracoccus solventivorans]SHL80205.1 hypothetical protein SAMN05444389_101423 [Paracoccus solventivorans]